MEMRKRDWNQPVYNFYAGPAKLPREVMRQVQDELLSYRQTGVSVMELSHRSREYESVHDEAQQLMKELLEVPPEYEVLFLQGGASTQFVMVPMNFLAEGRTAAYIHSGTWSGKAIAEAGRIGRVEVAASSAAEGFRRVPELRELTVPERADYVHITSNETIAGTQFARFPDTGDVPLVADMSSDILSRRIEAGRFGLIYAGAQKNLGPSGVTVVLVRQELLDRIPERVPDMMSYRVHARHRSLYHTPPTFSIYVIGLVLKWIRKNGGVAAMEQINGRKAELIYRAIDDSGGFYEGLAHRDSRSAMNVTFRVCRDDLERRFLYESERSGFLGLKGHRDAGHLRASLYNAVTIEECQALADFMKHFQTKFG